MIIFYKMNNCPYCVKAEEMLKEYIKNGSVVVKEHTTAPAGVRGFPHFVNTKNKLEYSGLPKSAEFLFESLKSVEKYINKNVYSLNKVMCGHAAINPDYANDFPELSGIF